jgi:hypothetical protein
VVANALASVGLLAPAIFGFGEPGGKTSASLARDVLEHLFGEGVEPVWHGQVRVKGDGEEGSYDNFVAVKLTGGADELLVSLRLVVRLLNYMAYRPRSQGSLLLLRAKAMQYAKEIGLSSEQLSLVIHGSVAAAMLVPAVETRSTRAMEGGSEQIVAWSERLTGGILREAVDGRLTWWGLLRLSLWWLWILAGICLLATIHGASVFVTLPLAVYYRPKAVTREAVVLESK